ANCKIAFTLCLCRRVGVDKYRVNCLGDTRHILCRVSQNAKRTNLVLCPRRHQLIHVLVVEKQRLLVTAGTNATYDELHAAVINWTSQRHPLAQAESVQCYELLSNDCSLPVVDECLPLGFRHF